MAQLLSGVSPSVDLTPFSPARTSAPTRITP
jgi:hypothetical protein